MNIENIKDCTDINYLKHVLNVYKEYIYTDKLISTEKKITDTSIRDICKSIIKNKHILICSQKAFERARQLHIDLYNTNNNQMAAFYRGQPRELYAINAYPIKSLLELYLMDKINENEFINKLYLIWVTKEESDQLSYYLKKSIYNRYIDGCKDLNINLTCTKSITPLDMYESMIDSQIYDADNLMLHLDFKICNQ